jgi:hypothetical protein
LREFAGSNILIRVPSRLRAYKASVFHVLAHPTGIALLSGMAAEMVAGLDTEAAR